MAAFRLLIATVMMETPRSLLCVVVAVQVHTLLSARHYGSCTFSLIVCESVARCPMNSSCVPKGVDYDCECNKGFEMTNSNTTCTGM